MLPLHHTPSASLVLILELTAHMDDSFWFVWRLSAFIHYQLCYSEASFQIAPVPFTPRTPTTKSNHAFIPAAFS